jgi:hypothetical protein
LKVTDDARPGCPEIVTEATVQLVEELIRADRRKMIDSVATALGGPHGLAYSIMHDHFVVSESALRVPRVLKDREKIKRIGLSLQHLVRYADKEDMLNRIVTGDELWVYQYQPESKRASPSTKKFKVMPSAGKVMLTEFWDSVSPLSEVW